MTVPTGTHTHIQASSSDTWTIDHGLFCNPIADVFIDVGGTLQKVLPVSVEYPTTSRVIVRFSSPRTGECRLI